MHPQCVIFATPSLDSRVSIEFLQSTIETGWLLKERGILHGFKSVCGDCFVGKARNKLVTEILREFPECTDVFFLDDDLGWPAHKVIEFLDRPEDVLAGIYPKKMDQLDYPVQLMVDAISGRLIERDGLVQAIGVPTGFLRIKRHVLDTLAEQSKRFKDVHLDGSTRDYFNIFEAGLDEDGWFAGEDYVFCRKWRSLGGEIWVDPDVKFTHRGQKVWSGDLLTSLPVFRERAHALKREAA